MDRIRNISVFQKLGETGRIVIDGIELPYANSIPADSLSIDPGSSTHRPSLTLTLRASESVLINPERTPSRAHEASYIPISETPLYVEALNESLF